MMRVTINESGVMRISADTPLEAYALNKWFKDAWLDVNDLDSSDVDEVGCYRGHLINLDTAVTPS